MKFRVWEATVDGEVLIHVADDPVDKEYIEQFFGHLHTKVSNVAPVRWGIYKAAPQVAVKGRL